MKRPLLLVAGLAALALGILGIFLPILPTTPFLLLAAYCFAGSSERLHAWLLGHSLFGPIIDNWERNRCISRKTKIVALTSMVLVGGSSVVFALSVPMHRWLALALMAIGGIVVFRIPVCPPPGARESRAIADQNMERTDSK